MGRRPDMDKKVTMTYKAAISAPRVAPWIYLWRCQAADISERWSDTEVAACTNLSQIKDQWIR